MAFLESVHPRFRSPLPLAGGSVGRLSQPSLERRSKASAMASDRARQVGKPACQATSHCGKGRTATLHGTTPKSVIPPSTTGRGRLPLPLAGEGWGGGSSVSGLFKIYGLTPAALGTLAAYLRREARRGKIRWRRRNSFHVKRVALNPRSFCPCGRAPTPTLPRKREGEERRRLCRCTSVVAAALALEKASDNLLFLSFARNVSLRLMRQSHLPIQNSRKITSSTSSTSTRPSSLPRDRAAIRRSSAANSSPS
jgi:hypothetical protein